MTARVWFTVAMAALTLALAGCADSGTSNKTTTPSLSPNDVTLTITGASVLPSGQPVVTFKLLDKNGVSYDQLTLGADPNDANLGATIAQYVNADGVNVFTSYWYNYLITTETKTAQKPGTAVNGVSVPQSTTEGTSAFPAGTLTYDKASQTYWYQFATNIKTIGPPANTTPAVSQVAYQAFATHRVALELRKTRGGGASIKASAYFDFVPDGKSALATREVVADSTCNNACHGQLEGHDGTRSGANLCVVCHNPNNYDGNIASSTNGNSIAFGNSLDFKIMVHRIHMGSLIPSTIEKPGTAYILYGDNDFPSQRSLETMPVFTPSRSTTTITWTSPNFRYDPLHLGNENFVAGTAANGFAATNGSNLASVQGGNMFPDCTKCHISTASTQGNSWLTTPTKEACGACHDNINFDGNTGPNLLPHAASSAFVSNGTCANSGCHNSQSIPTDTLHNYPVVMRGQADRFTYGADAVIYDKGTGKLSVSFHVVKDGQYIDYTDFTANPEFNPVSATSTTMPSGLQIGCSGQTYQWTSCQNISVPGYGANLTMMVGWSATEHTNQIPDNFSNTLAVASANTLTLLGTSNITTARRNGPCPGPNCTFTVTFPYNMPTQQIMDQGNTIVIGMYGRPGVLIQTGYNHVPAIRNPLVRATVAYFDVSSADAVSPIATMDSTDSRVRRVVVDEAKCGKCHDRINLHGQRNGNPQLCVICHNPNNTDVVASGNRGAGSTSTGLRGINAPYDLGSDGQREQAIDFKVMIHGIHAGGKSYACLSGGNSCPSPQGPLEGFRSRGITVSHTDYSSVNFPNSLSNCFACHKDSEEGKRDTFALPLPSVALPTTVTSMPPYSPKNLSGPRTQWESSRHSLGTTAFGFNGFGNLRISLAGHQYVDSTMDGSGAPVQFIITAGSGAALPTTSPQITTSTPYYIVRSTPAFTTSATPSFGLATVPGGTPIQWLAGGTDGIYAMGGTGTPFTLVPFSLADPTDDWNVSPTAAVCSSCHFDDQVKEHMVNTGGAVIEFPMMSTTGVTGITIEPGPMTDAQYRDVQSAQNGAGFEACSSCHGPGGVADVSKMHKLD